MDEKTFYDRVYLCQQQIRGIECKVFTTIKEATEYNTIYKNKKTKYTSLVFPMYERRATIIPICKYVPCILDSSILKYKLLNVCKIKIIH